MRPVDCSPAAPTPPAPRLLDRMRARIRVEHYPVRTEDTYIDWIKRFVLHFGRRHPH